MSVAKILGIVCGVLFGFLVCLIVRFAASSGKNARRATLFSRGKDFDERQLAVQGQASHAAYLALILTVLAYGIIDSLVDLWWIETFVAIIICICFSVAVFVLICIFRGAYFSRIDRPKTYILLFSLLSVANLLGAVRFIAEDMMFENGVLGLNSLGLIVGILLLVVDIGVIVKSLIDRRADELDAE